MILRDYQRDAVDSVYRHLRSKATNPVVVIPTGGGKTPCIATICRDAVLKWKGRVIVLSHVKELLEQSARHLVELAPELAPRIGVYSAGLGSKDSARDITVAGIQSVYKADINSYNLAIIDEAHLIPPDGEGMYRTFLARAREVNPKIRMVGMTATPFRMKSGPICSEDSIFQEICYEVGIRQLINQGFLCKLTAFAGAGAPDTSDLHVRAGEFIPSEVEVLMNQEKLVSAAVADMVERTRDRKSVLVFASSIAHAENVAAKLADAGEVVQTVFGGTSSETRAKAVADFKSGRLKFLVNVGVFTTGFDAPNVDAVALLRPTMSPGLFYQMCIDKDTQILSRRGWLSIHEVGTDDEIAAAGTATDIPSIRWEKPSNIIRRFVQDGERLYSIESPGVNMRITGGHDIVLTGLRSEELWKKQTAEVVAKRKDGYKIPVAGLETSVGINLSDDEIRFIGWFITDGNLNKTTNAITISQSSSQPHFDEIERVINGCGFKFGKREVTSWTQFNESAPRFAFTISKGAPRGRDKHLRGWGALEPFIDKELSPAIDDISEAQFDILLHAIHLGDGSKYSGNQWKQASYHISTGNKRFADRLQSLAVRRGWRCNVSSGTNNNNNPIYIIHCKKQHYRSVGGINQTDRAHLRECMKAPCELVWCVTVPSGAFVARRDGKAFITGNCGRGFRLSPGKENCLVLDYGGNVIRHGPIDAIKAPGAARAGKGGEAPAKECPECHALIATAYRVCPNCGHEFPAPKPRHDPRAAEVAILSDQQTVAETYAVQRVSYSTHVGRASGNVSMCVSYRCGLDLWFSEWVCFEHEGYARRKAESWWRERTDYPVPDTVDDAVAHAEAGMLREPFTITVARNPSERWPRIVGYEWPEETRDSTRDSTREPDRPGPDDMEGYEDVPF